MKSNIETRETIHKYTCASMAIANTSMNSSSLDLSSSSVNTSSSNKGSKKCLDDYEVVNLPNKTSSDLGKGSYGSVKLVKEKGNPNPNQLYAMKIVILLFFFFFPNANEIMFMLFE